MTNRPALALIAVVFTAACSSGEPVGLGNPTPTATASASATVDTVQPATSSAQWPECWEVFQAGQKVTAPAETGVIACEGRNGVLDAIPVIRCNDGTLLGSVESRTGAPKGWFLAGRVFHATTQDVAADPGYAAAYQKCHAPRAAG